MKNKIAVWFPRIWTVVAFYGVFFVFEYEVWNWGWWMEPTLFLFFLSGFAALLEVIDRELP